MEKTGRMMTVTLVCFSALPTTNAFAYLDPGSGSMIIQAVLAGIAAVSVSIGVFWRRIRSFFDGKNEEEETSDGK